MLALLLTGPCAATALAAGPQVFWASDPVRPDETVLVQGCDLGEAVVELARLEDQAQGVTGGSADIRWARVPILQASGSSLKFTVPADWNPGLFACRASSEEGNSSVVVLNAPDPWWVQGDEGAGATPGGWLRVFGKSLHFDRPSVLRLEPQDGKPIALEAVSADCYALRFVLPADLKPGQYAIQVYNGLGGEAGWRAAGTIRIEPPPSWPAERFSVLDFYGEDAEAEMRKTLLKYRPVPDRTEGIQAALKKAKENGGGVIYFPAGRYRIEGPITDGTKPCGRYLSRDDRKKMSPRNSDLPMGRCVNWCSIFDRSAMTKTIQPSPSISRRPKQTSRHHRPGRRSKHRSAGGRSAGTDSLQSRTVACENQSRRCVSVLAVVS